MKVLSILFLLFSFNLIADDGIADLQLGCKDPGAFHNQIPPSDIKITCEDFRTEWVATTADDAEIKNHRKVCSKAVTNKPNIGAPDVCEPCDWPGSPYSCGGFKEVEKEATMEFSVTCDEVLALKSIAKFCQDRMALEVSASQEKILSVKETGRVMKVCGIKNYMHDKPMSQDWKPVPMQGPVNYKMTSKM